MGDVMVGEGDAQREDEAGGGSDESVQQMGLPFGSDGLPGLWGDEGLLVSAGVSCDT